jgi:hypothetical protein
VIAETIPFTPSARVLRRFQGLAVVGLAALGAGFYFAPQRAWLDFLMASYALVCLGLAGLFFVALHYATGAGWSVAIRRVPEAMTAAVPVGAVGVLTVFLARPGIYSWYGEHFNTAEGYMGFKQTWLSHPFFVGRAVFYIALWLIFRAVLLRTSRGQDSTGAFAATQKNTAVGTAFLVVFGLSFWLASYDWVMSLEPHWYSTIFGVYNFAGLFESGLAVMALLVVWLRRDALRGTASREHLQDLSTLLFAFATFWMYIWFSQYMLIWYANLPEETLYFIKRTDGPWLALFVLTALLNWVVPFFLLLPRGNKRNPRVVAWAAVIVVLGRALDLYLMFLPPVMGANPEFHLWEAGAFLALIGVFGLTVIRGLRQAPLVPVGDPYLPESLHYHA